MIDNATLKSVFFISFICFSLFQGLCKIISWKVLKKFNYTMIFRIIKESLFFSSLLCLALYTYFGKIIFILYSICLIADILINIYEYLTEPALYKSRRTYIPSTGTEINAVCKSSANRFNTSVLETTTFYELLLMAHALNSEKQKDPPTEDNDTKNDEDHN